MFGYIRPVIPELKVKEYELYRAVYCGLCEVMGKSTSCASRLSLSYDFVFLAIVRMALAGEVGEIQKHRCLAHPTKKRSVLVGAGQLDYCARLSAVLTYHKLIDDISDSKGIKKLSAMLLRPFASHMRKKAGLGEHPEDIIKQKLGELAELEREGCASLDRAAEPFGELMAAVCAFGFEDGSTEYRIACEIGRHVGRFIYIIDAMDDLADDIRDGSYNPIVRMYGKEDAISKFKSDAPRFERALTMELVGIERAIELIEFEKVPEYGSIIKNIIYLGLPELVEKITKKISV